MDQTSAETAHLMALQAGEGLGVPQDWQAALDLLRRSAELGFPLAQSSLAALAGEWTIGQRRHVQHVGLPGTDLSYADVPPGGHSNLTTATARPR